MGHFLKTLLALLCMAFIGVASIWYTECYQAGKTCTLHSQAKAQDKTTVTSVINSILEKVQK